MLTVREYQKIFPDDVPNFDELSNFADAGDYLTLGWRYVQAKNYVGVIRLPSGFQIEILPKLAAPAEKLRALVVEMLRTLKDFAGKKFLDAALDTARLNLYEIFIRAYLELVAELVKRGLKASYVVREDNLNFFTGKLLVAANMRKNFVHREKFFVAFDEHSLNRAENRLIKSTLAKLLRTTRDPKKFPPCDSTACRLRRGAAVKKFRGGYCLTQARQTQSRLRSHHGVDENFPARQNVHSIRGRGASSSVAVPDGKIVRGVRCRTRKKNFLRPIQRAHAGQRKFFV